MHSSELEEVISADRAEAGVGGLVLAGSDGFDLFGPGVEGLTFFEGFIVVGHTAADVDHSLMTEDRMTRTRDNQLPHLPQRSCRVITPINIPTPLQCLRIGPSNHKNITPLSRNSPMKRRYLKRYIQRYDLPLQWLIMLDVADLDQMQGGVGDLEEVEEWLDLEEVFGLDAERVLLQETICAEKGGACGIWTFHAFVLV